MWAGGPSGGMRTEGRGACGERVVASLNEREGGKRIDGLDEAKTDTTAASGLSGIPPARNSEGRVNSDPRTVLLAQEVRESRGVQLLFLISFCASAGRLGLLLDGAGDRVVVGGAGGEKGYGVGGDASGGREAGGIWEGRGEGRDGTKEEYRIGMKRERWIDGQKDTGRHRTALLEGDRALDIGQRALISEARARVVLAAGSSRRRTRA
ncbi:hypothetical protein C8J57DRAFT_1212515 [Mycena rebaudengoi]|nr:hypothetical protein C8J57DRAFT_1212515 [Mycena rebaudengoi]